jgi:hypothetical protein
MLGEGEVTFLVVQNKKKLNSDWKELVGDK